MTKEIKMYEMMKKYNAKTIKKNDKKKKTVNT